MARFFIFLLLVVAVSSKNVLRDRRFIRGTYTSTVVETKLFTSWVPSSCVYVEPTLQPCRNMRYLKFPNFVANGWQSITEGQSERKTEEQELDPGIDASALGWAEYFGFYAPTITTTQTAIQTVTATDPRIVVTFAVKGCRPLKIPSELDRCPEDYSSRVPIQGIIPTSTIQSLQTSATIDPHELTTQKNARFIDLAAAKMYEDIRKSYAGDLSAPEQTLEGSQNFFESSEGHLPTKTLT